MENFKFNIIKVFRYFKIYGLDRTMNKISGRLRKYPLFKPKYLRKKPEIGLVGCGQFQFSTIAYYLSKGITNKFLFCYDVDKTKATSLGKYYNIPNILTNKESIYNFKKTKLVYIASNHFTHTEYAVNFIKKNIDVYCEKPISVNFEQFDKLTDAISKSNANFYAGYNRPYSPAITKLKEEMYKLNNKNGKFTLNCFISAHYLPSNHWYRNPKEGTRICGNVGHWIDLMIHIYNWREYIPDQYNVQIAYSNLSEPDDNISITITTKEGDLTSITISARSEPFEGINETINFQYDTIIAKIDDFRKLTIWNNHKLYKKKYWPKDVGHKRSIMQPFKNNNRALQEIISSTELMLHIAEMVRNTQTNKTISLNKVINK